MRRCVASSSRPTSSSMRRRLTPVHRVVPIRSQTMRFEMQDSVMTGASARTHAAAPVTAPPTARQDLRSRAARLPRPQTVCDLAAPSRSPFAAHPRCRACRRGRVSRLPEARDRAFRLPVEARPAARHGCAAQAALPGLNTGNDDRERDTRACNAVTGYRHGRARPARTRGDEARGTGASFGLARGPADHGRSRASSLENIVRYLRLCCR